MKKKIYYIHQYFRTPSEPGGTRSYWFAKELIKNGYDVVMLTTWENGEKFRTIKDIDGIKVIYLKVKYDNKMNVLSRILAFIKFMLLSIYYVLREKKVDLVFATSTPLTVGVPALINKWFKGIDYVFEVRDLWPEVPIQMGALNNKLLRSLLLFLESKIYKNAKSIIALSPGMYDGVSKVVKDQSVITTIPNMAKIDHFKPRKDLSYYFESKKFRVVHFGNMGIANGLDYIIEAACIAQEKEINDLEFVFLGDGKMREFLETQVASKKLNNVNLMGNYPMKETSEIVNSCDISLVTFANLPILATNSPNKLFDSLSAGKPIIVNSNGWTKKMVEENECGLYCDPLEPNVLVEKLVFLKDNPELVKLYGINSRKLAENKYDKSILCREFGALINANVI